MNAKMAEYPQVFVHRLCADSLRDAAGGMIHGLGNFHELDHDFHDAELSPELRELQENVAGTAAAVLQAVARACAAERGYAAGHHADEPKGHVPEAGLEAVGHAGDAQVVPDAHISTAHGPAG